MTNEKDIINVITCPYWDKMLGSSLDAGIFHSKSWARVLVDSYHYNPQYFTDISNGSLQSAIPVMEVKNFSGLLSGISLPFSDFISPIRPKTQTWSELIEQIKKLGKKRNWTKFKANRWVIEENDSRFFSSFSLEHFLLLTKQKEQIFGNFKNATKRNIKKALNSSLELNITKSFEAVCEYYKLHCLTRKFHGLPPQPFNFFKNVHHHIISNDQGIIIIAKFKYIPVAGAFFFHFGKSAIYKFGASNRIYQNLRANNLIMWKAIEYYWGKKFERFSFGITEPSNNGLLQFKRGYSPEERKVYSFIYDFSGDEFLSPKSFLTGFHNSFFSKLPLPLLRLFGELLYRYFP